MVWSAFDRTMIGFVISKPQSSGKRADVWIFEPGFAQGRRIGPVRRRQGDFGHCIILGGITVISTPMLLFVINKNRSQWLTISVISWANYDTLCQLWLRWPAGWGQEESQRETGKESCRFEISDHPMDRRRGPSEQDKVFRNQFQPNPSESGTIIDEKQWSPQETLFAEVRWPMPVSHGSRSAAPTHSCW